MIIIFFDFVSKKLIIFDDNDPIQMVAFTKNKIKWKHQIYINDGFKDSESASF